MKRGKDDEKVTGPMFPRLHVNDADKGGPKAPPRNKMALYEQLSIPSQRFSHSVVPRNSNRAGPTSSQGGESERGMFFSHQVANFHEAEKHYSPYSAMKIPLQQVEQRKQLDDDDYTVPTFIHYGTGKEFDRSGIDIGSGRFLSSNLSYLNHRSKFQKAKDTDHSSQEGRNQSAENTKDFAGANVKTFPGASRKIDVPGRNHYTIVDRTKAGGNLRAEVVDMSQLSGNSAVAKRNSLVFDSHLENRSSFTDRIDDMEYTEPREDVVCMTLENGTLERGDSVSETSILDSLSGHDITADDIVAIIGQKHFWKARKAIAKIISDTSKRVGFVTVLHLYIAWWDRSIKEISSSQQRAFAVQVFELHRLIKVQKLIAASPHLLLEDEAYLGEALKPSPAKKLPLNYNTPVKAPPTIAKPKVNLEKMNHRKEASAENSIERAHAPSGQNVSLPPSRPPSSINNIPSSAPTLDGETNARHWYMNQPQGHQWLIPVMSPSEGLVYKPYPAPGFLNQQDCNNNSYGCPFPMMGSFPTPGYGIPALTPHQYQFPPYPHGYYHPYGMPVVNANTLSASSVDQVNPMGIPSHVAPNKEVANCSNRRNEGFQDSSSNRPTMDIEVQGSTESSSSPGERQWCSERVNRSMENREVLPQFPANQVEEQPERPSQRVIRVVPHNATSVSESVARIIQSIEEERKKTV